MNLKELAGLVDKSDQGKADIEVKSASLSVNEGGELVVNGETAYRPNDWSWYGVFNKASKGTTKRYLFRHPPEQWVPLVNHDLRHSGDQDWILRTRGSELLGVVSGNYKKFDNREVVRALISNLGEKTRIHRHHLDDRFFFIRTLYPDGDFTVGGDTYHLGFVTFNSEVGFRALGNTTFIYRLVCTNDAQFQPHTRMVFRHVGHSFDDMSRGLMGAIDAGKGLKDFYAGLIRQASEEEIGEPNVKAVMAEVKKLLRLSKKRLDEIAQLYAEEGPRTKLGLVNAITHYAHRFRGDQRYSLEAGAGALLETSLVGQAA